MRFTFCSHSWKRRRCVRGSRSFSNLSTPTFLPARNKWDYRRPLVRWCDGMLLMSSVVSSWLVLDECRSLRSWSKTSDTSDERSRRKPCVRRKSWMHTDFCSEVLWAKKMQIVFPYVSQFPYFYFLFSYWNPSPAWECKGPDFPNEPPTMCNRSTISTRCLLVVQSVGLNFFLGCFGNSRLHTIFHVFHLIYLVKLP